MRVLVAGAALKGTLDCRQTTDAIARGVRDAGHEPIPVPIADGGDGSLVALSAAGFRRRTVAVHDALGRETPAKFSWDGRRRVAAVELAQAAGLWRVEGTPRDPWRLTSYGFGELLAAALALKPRTVLALLGGSATQDAGAGMLQALGAELSPPPEGFADAQWLGRADRINIDSAKRRFTPLALTIVSDVDHVLSGPDGSAHAFARQKGFIEQDISRLDAAIAHFGHLLSGAGGQSVERPGSGAAGGVGAALFALGGNLVPGARQLFETVGFFQALHHAQAVISCEGQVDATTWRGKAPGLAVQLALAERLPAILLCAAEGPGAHDIAASVVRAPGNPVRPRDLARAAKSALEQLAQQTSQ
ncbi:MAG: glycerate kinase [Thermaerobacter sp.]|nr:glycerate kinase [Thermaerobacter sp.]